MYKIVNENLLLIKNYVKINSDSKVLLDYEATTASVHDDN